LCYSFAEQVHRAEHPMLAFGVVGCLAPGFRYIPSSSAFPSLEFK